MITSPVNSKLKHARQVRDSRVPGEIFVEGERLCEECLSAGLPLVAAFHAPAPSARSRAVIAELERRNCPVYETAADVLDTVTDTVNSQGIVIIAARPEWNLEALFAPRQRQPDGQRQAADSPLIVCLDAVQDPGNCGTLVRTAEGAGAHGLLALGGTADAFAPKTLRSAMGSAFRLPIVTGLELPQIVAACRERRVSIAAAAAAGAVVYSDYDWAQPTLLILGNEANGVSAAALAASDVRLSIPLRPPVESLNVAAAAAVMLFEAARQRRVRGSEFGVQR
jgi:RNA methyltransferase, TrmH family